MAYGRLRSRLVWLECDELARRAVGPEVRSGQTKWTLHLGCGEMLDP